jgi:RNA polymerase-binding transcription factor DksA
MATKKKNTKKEVKIAKEKRTSTKKAVKGIAVAKKKSQSVTAKKKVAPAKPVKKAEVKKVTKTVKQSKPAPAKKVTPVKPVAKKVVADKKTIIKKVAKVEKQLPGKTKEKKVSAKPTAKETVVGIKKPVKQKETALKEIKIPKTSVKTSKPYTPDYEPLENRPVIEAIPEPTLRYSDTDLEEFRILINKKLDDATREVAYLQNAITRKDEGEDMDGRYATLEDGSLGMEREHLSQMLSRQITFINNLKKALGRIENKTYGICRVTGKLIDKNRLRAVPHATLSMEAKMGLRSKE